MGTLIEICNTPTMIWAAIGKFSTLLIVILTICYVIAEFAEIKEKLGELEENQLANARIKNKWKNFNSR